MKDSLGDRIKAYESSFTEDRILPNDPFIARIDGRNFSTFTKFMDRPFDIRMSRIMQNTVKRLIETFHPTIGYTQSDEITLVWLNNVPESEPLFAGKLAKLNSVLASATTAIFIAEAFKYWNRNVVDDTPHFDCRVFSVPSHEVVNAVYWRVLDAEKNSVSMAARRYFSHKELHQKNGLQMKEMLFNKGKIWDDYPYFFKYGTLVNRTTIWRHLSDSELENVPAAFRPTDLVQRSATIGYDFNNKLDIKEFLNKTIGKDTI